MKVIDDKYTIKCNCGSRLLYEKNDILYKEHGFGYIKCPCCEKLILTKEVKEINETNISFEYFDRFHGNKNIDKGKVIDEIKDYIKYLNSRKELNYIHLYVDDCLIYIEKDPFDEKMIIRITNDYYELITDLSDDAKLKNKKEEIDFKKNIILQTKERIDDMIHFSFGN